LGQHVPRISKKNSRADLQISPLLMGLSLATK
jgi:hypothetical protein